MMSALLSGHIEASLSRTFRWGTHDCFTFAMHWVLLATGRDLLAELPCWNTAREALLTIKEHGGFEAWLDDRLPRIDPRMACDGDLALHGRPAGRMPHSVLIFSGRYIIGPGPDHLDFLPREEAVAAWRVPGGCD